MGTIRKRDEMGITRQEVISAFREGGITLEYLVSRFKQLMESGSEETQRHLLELMFKTVIGLKSAPVNINIPKDWGEEIAQGLKEARAHQSGFVSKRVINIEPTEAH